MSVQRADPRPDHAASEAAIPTTSESEAATLTPTSRSNVSAEAARLAAVRRYDILDTPPDGAFDRIARIAQTVFGTPIAIVSIVDSDRIWFKSHLGTDATETTREPGLCASAILTDAAYCITDARTDIRSLANPLVAGEFGLRFYAAAPLMTSDGFALGTICVVDRRPRSVTADETLILSELAAIVVDELEFRLAARRSLQLETDIKERALDSAREAATLAQTDALTGLPNRRALTRDLAPNATVSHDRRSTRVAVIDLDGLKAVNDREGHATGDALLRTFADELTHTFRSSDTVYRMGGDEFAVLLVGRGEVDHPSIQARVAAAVSATRGRGFQLADASVGVSELGEAHGDPTRALALADQRMYDAKRCKGRPVTHTPDELDRRQAITRPQHHGALAATPGSVVPTH